MNGRPSCTACNGSGLVGSASCVRCPDVIEQCRDWLLLKCPPGVSGGGGDHACFVAACAIVGGFDIEGSNALTLLNEWNARCSPPFKPEELAHKIRSAQARARSSGLGALIWRGGSGARVAPRAPLPELEVRRAAHLAAKSLPFDPAALAAVVLGAPAVDPLYLRERSAVDPLTVGPTAFLNGLYAAGERVLVFDSFKSQGQWIFEVGKGWFRLGATPQIQAEKGTLTRSAREGIWFLAQPVTGAWSPAAERDGKKMFSRRSGVSVTAWRYMLLESDEPAIEADWLRLLVVLDLPIVALYTSGGRSVHALLRLDAASKEQWDQMRDALRPLLTKLGADKGVFSAVRLTRLPGCLREGANDKLGNYQRYASPREQTLLYFKPENHGVSQLPIQFQRRARIAGRADG